MWPTLLAGRPSRTLGAWGSLGLGPGALALALAVGVTLSPSLAPAAPCSGVPNPVYVAGTPAAAPLVEQVARMLQRDGDANPMTVVWQLTSACAGVEAVVKDTAVGSCAPGACITGKAQFWTQIGTDTTPKTCDLAATGTKVDLAVSDVGVLTCPAFAATTVTGIIDKTGPVVPYTLVMARQATESAMHAEEAHFVFGSGKAAGVRPWLNDAGIFTLGTKDAGQLLLGIQSKLAIAKQKGTPVADADELITQLATDPATSIGILPTTITDKRRNEVRPLAFQSIGQHGAFFPDRKSPLGAMPTYEKQNVRDGHYTLWGYLHMILREDPVKPKTPLSARGGRLAQILTANERAANKDILPVQVASGLVPQCAMRVARTDDASPLTAFAPADPCHCWFERNVTSGVLSCAECKDGITCGVGTCRRNVCEVQ